jgi:hypothetical protein
VNALVFYCGALFITRYGSSAEDVFLAIFGIMFGAFALGESQELGP